MTLARAHPTEGLPTGSPVGRMRGPAAVLAGAVVGGIVLHVVDPNQPGHYATCPFLALTGLYCPGCGSLRALHALTGGHIGEALARNPLTVTMVVLLAGMFAAWSVRSWDGRPRRTVAPAWLIWSLLGVVLAFWVLRNVPGWTWLSPA